MLVTFKGVRVSRKIVQGAVIFALLSTGASAQAAEDPTSAECAASHEKSQEYRYQSDLLKARTELRVCVASTCPGLLREDCTNWLIEVEEFMPSVVFEVEVNGEKASEVQVSIDGKAHPGGLDGVVELNPGSHEFVFDHAGFEPMRKRVVLRNGDKRQPIIAEFSTEPPSPAPDGRTKEDGASPSDEGVVSGPRPIPWTAYAFAGVAVAGGATAGTFWILGKQENRRLSEDCSPICTDSELKGMKTKLLIADVSAGVGITAGIAALYFYLTRPVVPEKNAVLLPMQVMTGPEGATISWRGQF
jgi:hypothetical protein